ncbi:hypothetical protein FIU85_09005 [Roseovarius sp. THAF8]|uniref:hypothetical protein n=1 Tax=Roseovarius sp. THAF8 TaxID=2587846 RepID=UPI0012A944B5|nr:hypothetical protein [Roseovarius sp. THAF8]QFT97437.1 hypothetical protein FIU85_09005 [Roseovarius sp. THAF8]
MGDRPACLGYGDTVCSSRGKCVSQDAACFESYQCNYEGFTCKSNLTECGAEYDGLLIRFNTLVDDYNELLEEAHDMRTEFQTALENLEETRRDLRRSEDVLSDVLSCIEGLGRLDDPDNCLP